MGYPLLGTRETWVVPTVFLATVLPSHAPRQTSGIRSSQTLPRWLPPATDSQIGKNRPGPDLDERPLHSVCHRTDTSIGQIRLFPSVVAVHLLTAPWWPEALNASGFRRACPMAISHNARSLIDFPEFAQAVRCGVPGTFESVGQGSLVTEHLREVSPLSRWGNVVRGRTHPRSDPLQSVVRFLPHPFPAVPLASFAGSLPSRGDSGVTSFTFSIDPRVRSCLSAGGATSTTGEFGAPVPDHVPFGSSLTASLACS